MAEVTTAVASAANLGLSAAALNAVGLDPVLLGLSFMACIVGAGFAPQMSPPRQALLFCGTVVCSAVVGKYAALRWIGSAQLDQALAVIGVGVFFHLLVGLAAKLLPDFAARWTGIPKADKQ